MENENSRESLEKTKNKILEQLSQLEHAPNAQMMTSQPGARRAPETFAGDSDDDDVWDPDTKSIRGKRCHLAEHFDDTDEGDTMDTASLEIQKPSQQAGITQKWTQCCMPDAATP